jgi:hypothetical protein
LDWVRIFDVGVRLFELGVGMFEVKVEIVGGDVLAVSIGVVDVHMPQLLFQVSHLQGSHLQMSAAAVMSFRDEDVYADPRVEEKRIIIIILLIVSIKLTVQILIAYY